MTDEADKPVAPATPAPGRSGRAIVSPIVENTTVSPSAGPSSDDCYTTLLHNADHDPGSSSGKRSGKRTGGCYCVLIQEPLPPLIAIIVSGEPGG